MLEKKNLKRIIILLIILFGVILFNNNTANAYASIIVENQVIEDMVSGNESYENSKYSIYINLNSQMIYSNLYENSIDLDALASSDGNIYQEIYIPLEDATIEKAVNKDENVEYEVIEIDSVKYLVYNLTVYTKESGEYKPNLASKSFTIEYTDSEGNTTDETFYISISLKTDGVAATLDIVDENGDYMEGGELTVWNNSSQSMFYTQYDYSEGYYQLNLYYYVGETIETDFGTFTYCGDEVTDNTAEGEYFYRTKITDTSIFQKAQSVDLIFGVVKEATGVGSMNRVNLLITGDTRQTYTVNDEEKNIGVSVNGVTDTGVSLQVEDIEEDSETYIEMSSLIINNNEKLFVTVYDISLVGGSYEGDLLITFNFGTEIDGQEVEIWHKLADDSYESFYETVEDGKVTIKVTELSPFLIAYVETEDEEEEEEKTNTTEEIRNNETSEELDNTPKTGTTSNVFEFVLAIGIFAMIVIISIKK